MKIFVLVLKLINFRLKGYKYIEFWVSDNIPASDFCDFIIKDKETICLLNFINN